MKIAVNVLDRLRNLAGRGQCGVQEPVSPEEQDRLRIEKVDALWSTALPAEVEKQWSLFPNSHPIVLAETNRRASGDPIIDPYFHLYQFLIKTGAELPLTRTASVCCGAGALERGLASLGLISACTGYDLATGALEAARNEAEAAGYNDLHYERRDLENHGLGLQNLQMVFAHQGLHHIEGLEATLDAIRDSLEIGGYFHLHEFVGPDRFQWTDQQLQEMTAWLNTVPEHYRRTEEGLIRDRVTRATIEEMIAADPSEAIRSSAIEPLVEERFEIVERRALGMTFLSALAGIAHNFSPDDPEAVSHLMRLLDREAELIEAGTLASDFVTILARRVS